MEHNAAGLVKTESNGHFKWVDFVRRFCHKDGPVFGRFLRYLPEMVR